MKFSRVLLGALIISLTTLTSTASAAANPAQTFSIDDASIVARSLVSTGDTARLERVMAKARRGEAITVGVIGGSITQGAAATKPEKRYGNIVAAWWRAQFPKSKVQFVNAGIGATGSDYGAMRASRDLLSHRPDFVIVEYAVNDGPTQKAAETLEGLVRQILKQTNAPAVLLLFMVNEKGGSAQPWFVKVGEHYRLPMVSYRDAFWPEIEAGRMKWTDISPDAVHPNDRGHAEAARFITVLLEIAVKRLPSDGTLLPIPPVPAPRFTDIYEHTALLEADALKPVANNGWAYNTTNRCWKSMQPGSVIEFEISGQVLFTMHWVIRGPMGRAKVTVDAQPPITLEGWFDQTWGGYRKTTEIARSLSPGKHRVRFELLPDKSAGSTGYDFRILGLGAAGI